MLACDERPVSKPSFVYESLQLHRLTHDVNMKAIGTGASLRNSDTRRPLPPFESESNMILSHSLTTTPPPHKHVDGHSHQAFEFLLQRPLASVFKEA